MPGEIGRLFPAGGPVPPDLVIGRNAEIDELTRRLSEAVDTLVVGPRRIGKTTICEAACARVAGDGAVILAIEVPERADARALLQLIIDRASRLSMTMAGRRLLQLGRPLIEKVLADEGIPLDLGQLDSEESLPTRKVLSLPLSVAAEHDRPLVFFLDELQRAADYADGEQTLIDLVDIYSGEPRVRVLADGSSERAVEGLLGDPVHFGKLCNRMPISSTIPERIWRDELPGRFGEARLEIESDALEAIVGFGAGRPYATMIAARCAAMNARRLGTSTVARFEAVDAVAEAERHLEDDDV